MSIMTCKFLPYRTPNIPSSLGTSGERCTLRVQPPFPFGHHSVCHESGDSLGHKLPRALIAAVLKWFFEGINHSQLFWRCVYFGVMCCHQWCFSSTRISYKDLGLPKPQLATKACSFLLDLWEGNFLGHGWTCWILKATPIEWLILNYTWWDARFYSTSAVLILEDLVFIGRKLEKFWQSAWNGSNVSCFGLVATQRPPGCHAGPSSLTLGTCSWLIVCNIRSWEAVPGWIGEGLLAYDWACINESALFSQKTFLSRLTSADADNPSASAICWVCTSCSRFLSKSARLPKAKVWKLHKTWVHRFSFN